MRQARKSNTRFTLGLQGTYNLGVFRRKVRESAGARLGSHIPRLLRQTSMPSTHKKVVVRKMDRDSVNGYVAPANFVHDGKLELLNTAGNLSAIELRGLQGAYFFPRVR